MSRPESWVRDLEALRSFWAVFLLRSGARPYTLGNRYSRWRTVGAEDLVVACYVTDYSVGVFLRGLRGESSTATRARLGERLDRLATALNLATGVDFLLVRRWVLDTEDPARWPEMADWLHDAGDRVVGAARRVSGSDERMAA